MNKVQKIEYIKELEEHLERNNVYQLFERLTRELVINQPEKPIEYLINLLKHPKGRKYPLM